MGNFFDDLADSISNVFDSVGDKAKKTQNISNLRSQIRGQEKIIENMKKEIANKYVEEHRDDESAPYQAQMQEIKAAEVKIRELKAEVEAFKNN